MTDLERLSQALIQCPTCRGDCDPQEYNSCETCHGSGQVAVVPGLLRPCSECGGKGKGAEFEEGDEMAEEWICIPCGGTGSVPVSDAEALDKMLDWAMAQRDQHGEYRNYWEVQFEPSLAKPGWIWCKIERLGRNDVKALVATPAQALATAILQAMEVKHD